MGKGRPGGNPALVNHQFTKGGEEALTEHLQLRISKSMKQKLLSIDDYKEFIRQAITEKLAQETVGE